MVSMMQIPSLYDHTCRRVWGQEPSAALPGVSATQGLHNAAGLADRQ